MPSRKLISITDARMRLKEIYNIIKRADLLVSDGVDLDDAVIHLLYQDIEELYLSNWTIQYY